MQQACCSILQKDEVRYIIYSLYNSGGGRPQMRKCVVHDECRVVWGRVCIML